VKSQWIVPKTAGYRSVVERKDRSARMPCGFSAVVRNESYSLVGPDTLSTGKLRPEVKLCDVG
jgi:hypothetical protein